MLTKSVLLLKCLILLLLFQPVQAEHGIALLFTDTGPGELTAEEISLISGLGIRSIFTMQAVSGEEAARLSQSGISLTGVLPLPYLHTRTAAVASDNPVIYARQWPETFSVTGFGDELAVGFHPDLNSETVRRFYEDLSRRISEERPDLNLYLFTDYEGELPGDINRIPTFRDDLPDTHRMLLPSVDGPNTIRKLREIFRSPEDPESVLWVIHYHDFLRYMHHEQWFAPMLQSVNEGDSEAIAVPARQPETPPVRASVILLLILWLSFSVNYRFNPNYNRTVVRYFMNHEFMVDDILNRRIIMRFSTVVMMLQTALLCGITFSSGIYALTGDTGRTALGHFYPILSTDAGLFAFFFMAGLAFSVISWLWLVACCFRQDILSQAATLMLWHMHLAFPLVTILVTVVISGFNGWIVTTLSAAFILLMLSGFYIAALRFGRMPTFGPGIHYSLTIILYTAALAGMTYLIYTYSDFFYVMRMAVNL